MDDHTKRELITAIRAEHLRWVRNAMALGGCALAIGCTVALNPLVGGLIAGVLMFGIAVSGMILSRKAEAPNEKDK